MLKKLCVTGILVSVILLSCSQKETSVAEKEVQTGKKVKVGVLLSGCGMQDGTEIYEAAFTILALENSNAEIIFMAPDISQSSVMNHLKNEEENESRNVLVESARIARGNVKNIKDVKESDLDALIIPGGMGAITTLADIMASGENCTVEPNVEALIKEMYIAKKPIGSMCAASMVVSKVLGDHKAKVTIGKENEFFGPMLKTFGAIHVESGGDSIVIDDANNIVSTPAVMSGESNSVIYIGINKMVQEVLKIAKK